MKKALKSNLTLNLYLKLMPAQLLSLLSASLSTLISIAIVGNCLNDKALATVNVVGSFTNMIAVFSTLICSGVIFIVNRSICQNNEDEKTSAFSSSVIFSLIVGMIVFVLCAFYPKIMSFVLGCNKEIYIEFSKYIKGISFGYSIMILSALLNVVFQIHSDTKKTINSSIILFAANVIFNILFLYILKLDIFFAGLSITLSQIVSFIYLFICYSKHKHIKFSIKKFSIKTMAYLIIIGFTQSFVTIASSFKNLYIKNIMASAAGGVKALSTMASINAVDSVTFFLFSSAFIMVTMMVSSIFINEKDREGLKEYTKNCFKIALVLFAILSAFMFFSSYFTVKLLNVEDPQYTGHAQRVFAFAIFGFVANMTLIKIFGNLEKVKAVNILSLISGFVVPSLVCTILVKFIGNMGLWYSFIFGDLCSLLCTLTYVTIHNKRIPRSVDELLCLDKDFGVSKDDTIHLQISTIQEVEDSYVRIIDFCKSKGFNPKVSNNCGLCFEEIATNIIEHGFKKNCIINASVIYENETVKMIIRDNCRPFDPNKRFSQLDKQDPFKGIGIRIIMGIADKVDYKSIYGLNILSITLKNQ